MNRLWIDDIRLPSEKFNYHSYNSKDAIALLQLHPFRFISFDHDLGGEDTAYEVAKWIELAAYNQSIQRMGWAIHSANPVGVHNIRMAMKNAERFWNKMDEKFYGLLENWHEETGFLSNMNLAAEDKNYLEIIKMGKPIVGTILKYIDKSPDHLFIALHKILQTGPEIPEETRGCVAEMCKIWYDWGVKEGYVSE